jgi:anti-sigma factor RsiW
MNHNPYENWILDDIPITADQKRELFRHMDECPECARLYQGWSSVQHTLRQTQIQPAPADFTTKWTASLIHRKRVQEKKQARNLVISLGTGAVATLIALGFILLPDLSLISLVARSITSLTALVTGIESFWLVLFKLAQAVPSSSLIATLLVVSGWVLLASFTLGYSVWKLAFQRKVNK